MHWYFLFFAVSGFCSLLYQVAWLRVSMAEFGVTTPSISITLSVFMAGLSLGSWGGGRLVSRLRTGTAGTFLRLYGIVEVIIGLSGLIVAPLLKSGHHVLLESADAPWGSGSYYVISLLLITLVLLPFCTCMGATFPLAMAAVRCSFAGKSATSFSYLYVANLLGALAGCLLSAFILIELLGFRGTMLVAVVCNLCIAAGAFMLANGKAGELQSDGSGRVRLTNPQLHPFHKEALLLLFTTGVASLAMEIVWTRQFMPFMGPVVYTFAAILATYLAATFAGAKIYRRYCQHHRLFSGSSGWKMVSCVAGLAALLPLVATDFRVPFATSVSGAMMRLVIGIGPFCFILGLLTPGLIDRFSGGDPRRAGFAYSLNSIGCIIGPLFAGFMLLPFIGEKWSLVLLALPLFLFGFIPEKSPNVEAGVPTGSAPFRLVEAAVLIVLSVGIAAGTKGYEQMYPDGMLRRDATATVIATGSGMDKSLLVNGYGVTFLTPITKAMVHLPLAFLPEKPRNGLVLCLGMGTSYRSMLSWGIAATVVELVPSVPELLPYFHQDGEQLLRAGNGRIVTDDARRYLERTREKFDVIVVDPPPPLEAAASSLLYSVEFYDVINARLSPDGIFQQWIPLEMKSGSDPVVVAAMAKALVTSFPYIRAFFSYDYYGVHILASKKPIPNRSSAELVSRLPAGASRDLLEWGPYSTPQEQLNKLIMQEVSVQQIIAPAQQAQPLTDDRPVNEYYLLRRLGWN